MQKWVAHLKQPIFHILIPADNGKNLFFYPFYIVPGLGIYADQFALIYK